jgi:membrane protease YdiL (CAAX protease family)
MIDQEISIHIRSVDQRITAVCEVLGVFLATFTLIWLTALLPIGQNERRFLNYIIMVAFPLLILLITRRDLKTYGLTFHPLRDQLNIALAVLPLVLIDSAIYGWLLPKYIPNAIITWQGTLILSLTSIVFFVMIAWILRSKPSPALVFPALLISFPVAFLPSQLVSFLFYLLFLGPAEEFLFRGYIQSRLNAAFGRPFRFWGVSWGWGLVITSLIFGLMHVLNPFNPFLGEFDLYIWWGIWTVFGGLTFGYIREKAGSILPTALLHGLPQAIASLMFGFFAIR